MHIWSSPEHTLSTSDSRSYLPASSTDVPRNPLPKVRASGSGTQLAEYVTLLPGQNSALRSEPPGWPDSGYTGILPCQDKQSHFSAALPGVWNHPVGIHRRHTPDTPPAYPRPVLQTHRYKHYCCRSSSCKHTPPGSQMAHCHPAHPVSSRPAFSRHHNG